MEFNMPEETQEIINGIKQFINKVVIPLEEENRDLLYNERKYYLEDGRRHPKVEELRRIVRKESAKAGFYTMFGAEELGGGGFGPLTALLVNEAIGKHYPHRKLIEHVVIPSPFTNGLTPVLNGLKQELKDKYIEGIGSGEKTLCFGLTEPDAGSDVWGIKTRAVKDGNEWVLNERNNGFPMLIMLTIVCCLLSPTPNCKRNEKAGLLVSLLKRS
jgi:acyl-CoA dehydrogenase